MAVRTLRTTPNNNPHMFCMVIIVGCCYTGGGGYEAPLHPCGMEFVLQVGTP